MSRSTKAFKRLGVPGLAAVTLVAGLPLFLGSAQAAPQSLDLTPTNGTGNAGVCIPFTVQVNFTPASSAAATVVDVSLTKSTPGTDAATQDVDFCTAATGTVTPATPADQQDGGTTGPDHAEFTTNAAGKVTFGVVSNQTGTADVRAFLETTDNDTFNAGEITDSSTATFGAGGDPGSNANQNAAGFVEVVGANEPNPATATVVANNDTDNAIEGEARTYRVFVGSDASNRLAGVSVNYTITGATTTANVGPTSFGATNNNGIVTGTITFPVQTGAQADADNTVTFYVNQTTGATNGPDAGEPADTTVVTVRDNGGQQNRTITLTPQADNGDALDTESGTAATNRATDGNRTFRAVVDAATGQPSTVGTQLAYGVAGGSGDETVTPIENATQDNTATADTNDSFADVVVNDPTPIVGQTLTVTATIRATSSSATATLTFRNAPSDARFITLSPKTVQQKPNTAQTITATVTDVDGKPVQGVTVTFTEDGAGAFRNGSSNTTAVTNASGEATVETVSLPGETGDQTITATLPATGNQSKQPAGQGMDPQGNDLTAASNPGTEPAGRNSDTSTVTFTNTPMSPSPSPSSGTPSPTMSMSPSMTPTSPGSTPTSPGTMSPSGPPNPACVTPASVTLEKDTIIATGSAGVTVKASANSVVQLFAYTRPSTTFRVVRQAEVGADGTATFRVVPPANTRLYAQQMNCNASPSVVLNVRTALSLFAKRNGVRDYTFTGDSLPARPGGLIISLYRVTNDGRQVLTSQVRASATNGEWTINRKFTGSGRFGFVVRTGQDLQNAPGSSNIRPTLIY